LLASVKSKGTVASDVVQEQVGRLRPLMLVLEEAHANLVTEHGGTAASAVRGIAKEGREYGVGL